jgi:hypothetical protein
LPEHGPKPNQLCLPNESDAHQHSIANDFKDAFANAFKDAFTDAFKDASLAFANRFTDADTDQFAHPDVNDFLHADSDRFAHADGDDFAHTDSDDIESVCLLGGLRSDAESSRHAQFRRLAGAGVFFASSPERGACGFGRPSRVPGPDADL